MLQTYRRRRSGVAPVAVVEPFPVLPDDVIEDILARLPAKTVHMCRCLSCTWAARLVSDDFADRHFRLANRRGVPKVLFLQDSNPPDGCGKVQVWSQENSGGTTLMEFPPSDDHVRNNLVPCLVTQQCRGLVILKAPGYTLTYHVLNPSTGRMTALPKSPAMARGETTRLGLGYDTSTKKHKVVCIYNCDNGEKISRFNACEVYVINSATNDWRSVEGCVKERQRVWVNHNEESVFAQRHVHWLAKLDAFSKETFVFSFSLDDETSRSMPLPPLEMGRKCFSQRRLTELRQRLCLFRTEMHNGAMWALSVCLLHDHDTCEWDLHCRIHLDTLPPKVASFMRSGPWISLLGIADSGRRIILVRPRPGCTSFPEPSFMLCSYDPMTNDMENLLDDSGLVSNSDMVLRHAALYEESIASPGQPLAMV